MDHYYDDVRLNSVSYRDPASQSSRRDFLKPVRRPEVETDDVRLDRKTNQLFQEWNRIEKKAEELRYFMLCLLIVFYLFSMCLLCIFYLSSMCLLFVFYLSVCLCTCLSICLPISIFSSFYLPIYLFSTCLLQNCLSCFL